MRHTLSLRLKKDAIGLLEFIEMDSLIQLFKKAQQSNEAQELWDESDSYEYFIGVMNITDFLIEFRKLMLDVELEYPKDYFPHVTYNEYRYLIAAAIDTSKFENLIKKIIHTTSAKQLAWNLWTLLICTLDGTFKIDNPLEYANLAYSIKEISNFLFDCEVLYRKEQQDVICLDESLFELN